MKHYLFNLLNLTLGRALRIIEKMRTIENHPPQISVVDLVERDSIIESADYAIKHFPNAMIFENREKLWDYCINNSFQSNTFLEFGVWQGESINYFAKKFKDAKLFGFDSFTGLEEDWTGTNLEAGHFNLGGKLPAVSENVVLVDGWFEETLPKFLIEYQLSQVSILHLDADTYSPTKFVLDSLSNFLNSGSIVIFDEYFGYPNWKEHEHLAWIEFTRRNALKVRPLAYSKNQVAFQII